MTDHIDHAAEADRLMKGASAFGDEMRIAQAQVHATLALVEAQRTAIEIAYLHLQVNQYAEARKRPEDFDWDTEEASVQRTTVLAARVQEGLGLS